MAGSLTEEDSRRLLALARQALERALRRAPVAEEPDLPLPSALEAEGASFVTLTHQGSLRGCVGTLEPTGPLADDVCRNVVAAALSDPRFPPVTEQEIQDLAIEVACLTPLEPMPYETAEDLMARIRPGVDGVLLRSGSKRATFLPKVWEKVTGPEEFLDQLCRKMGVAPDQWRQGEIEVFVYQTETMTESSG